MIDSATESRLIDIDRRATERGLDPLTAREKRSADEAVILAALVGDGITDLGQSGLNPSEHNNLCRWLLELESWVQDERVLVVGRAVRGLLDRGETVTRVSISRAIGATNWRVDRFLDDIGPDAVPLALANLNCGEFFLNWPTVARKRESSTLDPWSDWPEPEDVSTWIGKPELPDELATGLFHRGSVVVLGGASKSNKTWTLIYLAIALSRGLPWIGFPTMRSRVLYVNFEVDAPFFRGRIQVVQGWLEVDLDRDTLKPWTLAGRAVAYEFVLAGIRARFRPGYLDVIIIDPMYMILGKLRESEPGDMTIFFNALKAFAVEYGATMVVASHFSKGAQGGKNHNDRISGSGVFSRAPDVILTISELQREDEFVMAASFRNLKRMQPIGIRWQYPYFVRDETIDVTDIKQPGAKPESRPSPKRNECEDAIAALLLSGSLSSGEIADRVPFSRATVMRAVASLVENRTVWKVPESGKYALTYR